MVKLNAGGSHPQIAFVTEAGEQISYPQGGLVLGTKVVRRDLDGNNFSDCAGSQLHLWRPVEYAILTIFRVNQREGINVGPQFGVGIGGLVGDLR